MPHGEALAVTDPVAPLTGRRPGWWPALRDRVGHLVRELGKFGTVGAVAFGVDTALFTWLNAGLEVEPLLAKTLATLVSASVAFVGNRFWTWRHRARSGLGREYLRYFLLNVVGLAIALAVLALSHYVLGAFWPVLRTDTADLIAANVVGNALGTLFRFWSYRRFVFLLADSPQVGRPPADPRQSG
nr:GtrA family protein [Pilimelia terevasa]